MRTLVLAALFVFSVCKIYTQTYFDKDYHFNLHQASGGSVFYNTNYYSSVSNIINDVNIPGGKYKWKPIFSSYSLNGDTLFTKKLVDETYSSYFYTTKRLDIGYISVGVSSMDTTLYSFSDSTRIIIARIDENGDTLWCKYYGYDVGKRSFGYDIYQEADSGFVVCGITNRYSVKQRAMLLRLDKDGNVLWEKTYPNAGSVDCYSLAKSPDGGYLLGCTQWGGGGDIGYK